MAGAVPNRKPGRPAVIPDTKDLVEVFTLAALHNGSMEKAASAINEQRAEQGLEPYRADTLRRYRRTNRELYEKTRGAVQESVRQTAADRHMEAAELAMDVESELTKRLKGLVDKIDPRDLPGAIRNAATAAGIHRDKALALTGDAPGGVSMTFNFGEQVRGLAAKGARFFDSAGQPLDPEKLIEGKAKEITEESVDA